MNTLEEFREAANVCLEPELAQYINGGAGRQPIDNAVAFQNYVIRPYLIGDTSNINISTTILGHHVSLPVCIAPMGRQDEVDSKAEHITASAAKMCGVGFTMSAWASVKMEDLVTLSDTGLKFLNIYIYRNKSWTEYLVRKAEECGFHGFVVGFAKMNPAAKRLNKSAGKRTGSKYANLEHLTQAVDPADPDYPLPAPDVNWSDVIWLKSITKLPVIVKGVLSARDAIQAVNSGADAILVSNHGGRQLEGVPATIDVLPEVVSAVRSRCEVYIDGGVRSGADLYKALALGAKAAFIGRPVLWGMACGAREGVMAVLEIYRRELIQTMILSGVSDVNKIPGDVVVRRESLSKL